MANSALFSGTTTFEMQALDKLLSGISWVLDITLRPDFERRYTRWLIANGQYHSLLNAEGFRQLLECQVQLPQLTEAQRDLTRQQWRQNMLPLLRVANDEFSKEMVHLYDTAHPPIDAGHPPITREMVTSLVDIRLFMIRAAFPSLPLNETDLREKLTNAVLENLDQSPMAERQKLSTAPLGWAELRVEWEKMNPWQKQATATQWAQMVGPMMNSLLQRDNATTIAPKHESTADESSDDIAHRIARGSQIQTIMNLNWRYRL